MTAKSHDARNEIPTTSERPPAVRPGDKLNQIVDGKIVAMLEVIEVLPYPFDNSKLQALLRVTDVADGYEKQYPTTSLTVLTPVILRV